MRVARRLPLVVGLALTLGLPAHADLAPWDQERVGKLAVELAVAVKDLREDVRKVPGHNLGTLQSRSRHRLLDALRLIRSEARHLAAELQGGAGREETMSIYERIGSLSRDARENANRMQLPEPVLAGITRAGSLWSQLTPYYDPDWKAAASSEE